MMAVGSLREAALAVLLALVVIALALCGVL